MNANLCLALLFKFIIENYYRIESHCILVYGPSKIVEPLNVWHTLKPMLATFQVHLNETNATTIQTAVNEGCQMILILGDNVDEKFVLIERAISRSPKRFHERTYIFATDRQNLTTLFERDQLRHVVNVIVAQLSNYNFDLFTHRFVGGPHEQLDKIHVATWMCDTLRMTRAIDLLPDKIANMNGRDFVSCIIEYLPFTVLPRQNGEAYGFEYMITAEYAGKINATLKTLDAGDDFWGYVNENFTGAGLLGNVAMGKADASMAAIYLWDDFYPFTDYTFATAFSRVTLLTPSPGVEVSLLTPLLPLTVFVWIALATSFAYISVGLNVISKVTVAIEYVTGARAKPDANHAIDYYTLQEASVVTLGMLLSQFIPSETKKNNFFLYKFASMVILFFALIVNVAYNSGYSAVMTLPRYQKSVRYIQDIIDFKLEWGHVDIVWLETVKKDDNPTTKRYLELFRTQTEEQIHERCLKKNYGVLVEQTTGGSLSLSEFIGDDCYENLQLMRETLWLGTCTIAMKKSSVYLNAMNAHVLAFWENGIIYFWESNTITRFGDVKKQTHFMNSLKENTDQDPVVLQNKHLIGTYILWAFGLLLSAGCFVQEVWHVNGTFSLSYFRLVNRFSKSRM